MKIAWISIWERKQRWIDGSRSAEIKVGERGRGWGQKKDKTEGWQKKIDKKNRGMGASEWWWPPLVICRFKAWMSFVSKLRRTLPFTVTQSAAALSHIYHQMSQHTHNWIHRAAGCLAEHCRSALLCSPLAGIFQPSSFIQELGSLSPGFCSGCLFLSTHPVITRPRRETASRINCMKKPTCIEIKSRHFKDVSNDEMTQLNHPKEFAQWMPARSR